MCSDVVAGETEGVHANVIDGAPDVDQDFGRSDFGEGFAIVESEDFPFV